MPDSAVAALHLGQNPAVSPGVQGRREEECSGVGLPGGGGRPRLALVSRDGDLVLYFKGPWEPLKGFKQNFILQIAHWRLGGSGGGMGSKGKLGKTRWGVTEVGRLG